MQIGLSTSFTPDNSLGHIASRREHGRTAYTEGVERELVGIASRLRQNISQRSHRLAMSPRSNSVLTTTRGKRGVFGKRWIPRQQAHHEGDGAAASAQTRTRTLHRGTCAHDDTICVLLITPYVLASVPPHDRPGATPIYLLALTSKEWNITTCKAACGVHDPDAPVNTSYDRTMKIYTIPTQSHKTLQPLPHDGAMNRLPPP